MRVLVVSGEYPPMRGGVGRYTQKLVRSLIKKNIEVAVASNNCTFSKSGTVQDDERIYGIIKKGDLGNSDRLLQLVHKFDPDIVNIQYERGLYESDTSIRSMLRRIVYGSTLDKLYRDCPVPTISTLHTIFPFEEYQQFIRERASRQEGRLGFLPEPFRAIIRKWVMERRYKLLLEVAKKSNELICPAITLQKVIGRGTVIYHGAEPVNNGTQEILSPSEKRTQKSESSTLTSQKLLFRKELGLPFDRRLLLAFGYVGSYKGFEILADLELPVDWTLVVKQNKHERGLEKPVQLIAQNIVNLHLDYVDDDMLSRLFFACDAIILPYKVVSVSGILFDALAHGLPFIASDLKFFQEFAELGLGLVSGRNGGSFSLSLKELTCNYEKYKERVDRFALTLRWSNIADQHIELFSRLIDEKFNSINKESS